MTTVGRAQHDAWDTLHGERNLSTTASDTVRWLGETRSSLPPVHEQRRGFLSLVRSLSTRRAEPAADLHVLAGGDFGSVRLLRALDQIQLDPPRTIAGWKTLAQGILVDECCAVHRNREISAAYAWAYMALPAGFKWAGMAAIASHHVRVALLPLHIETFRSGGIFARSGTAPRRPWGSRHAWSRTTSRSAARGSSGHVDRPGMLRVFTEDVNTLRATNNDIFDDLFWVHLAYVTSEDGIGLLRGLLRDDRRYAPVLAGFEAIDQGRRVLEDATATPAARARAQDLVWEGNVLLLEHEQRVVVQPNFDRLSGTCARVVSIGSATTFETRGLRQAIQNFTSFFVYTLVRANPRGLAGRLWPRITNYDDRWRWLESSVVPRFQRFDADPRVVRAILERILAEDRHSAPSPCDTPPRNELIRSARPERLLTFDGGAPHAA